MRVRVVCPPERSAAVTDLLGAHDGVADVVRFAGAALFPAGDVLEADVAREAADGLLDDLHGLDLGPASTVTLATLDVALGDPAEHADDDAPGSGDDAVVWDELLAATRGGSSLSASFLLFLTIATMIAAVGLLTDSQVLIVGSMILGPEFSPLAGIGVALVRRRWRDCVDPLRVLAIGFVVAIVVTAGFVALLDLLGQVPGNYRGGSRPEVSFVYEPGVFSGVVALLAGIAGTLSLTSAKSSALVGVFVSVTTVPAGAEIGAGLVTGQASQAGGAAVQLAVNLAFIVLAAVLTLAVQRIVWRRIGRDPMRRRVAGRDRLGPAASRR
jgi:uncharacterized hydrophobic protein (TIGR00271 family)